MRTAQVEGSTQGIRLAKQLFIVAELCYVTDGFRGSVIFSCGMILEDNGEVKIDSVFGEELASSLPWHLPLMCGVRRERPSLIQSFTTMLTSLFGTTITFAGWRPARTSVIFGNASTWD